MSVYRVYLLVEVEADTVSDAFNAVEDGMRAFAPSDWCYAHPQHDDLLKEFDGLPIRIGEDD